MAKSSKGKQVIDTTMKVVVASKNKRLSNAKNEVHLHRHVLLHLKKDHIFTTAYLKE